MDTNKNRGWTYPHERETTANEKFYVVEYKYIYVIDMFSTEVYTNRDIFTTEKDAVKHAKHLRNCNTAENYPNFEIKIYKQELVQWE